MTAPKVAEVKEDDLQWDDGGTSHRPNKSKKERVRDRQLSPSPSVFQVVQKGLRAQLVCEIHIAY
jgi:hypothetical protein